MRRRMSSDENDDELELLSTASHAPTRFVRRFSDDEDGSSSELDEVLNDSSGAAGRLRHQWNDDLSDSDNSMSEDTDSDASASDLDDDVAEQMRREYANYQREREERSKATEVAVQPAATHAAAGSVVHAGSTTVESDAPSTQNLQIVEAALRANRQLQECIREQLDKLEGARLANATALAEWQQDQRRVRQADRAMRGLLKRQHATALRGSSATVRYRQGGSYFGKDAPPPGDVATQKARQMVVNLVPLTYPSAKWSAAETEKLRQTVRQSCQHRAMVILDQQTEKEDVAQARFGPSGRVDEEDEYTRQVNELRSLTLLQLLHRLEEDGALAAGGAVCGEDGGKRILSWDDVATRSRLRRTADDCRVHWNAVADPRIDVSDWSDAETNTLQTLAQQHEGHSWERIASQVGSGRRTAFACFRQYQFTKIQLGRRAWNDPTENARLVELVKEVGPKWREVARRLGTGRKPSACMHRYRYAVGTNDDITVDSVNEPNVTEALAVRESATVRRGTWSPEEDIRLEEAVRFHTEQAERDVANGIKRKRTGRLPVGTSDAADAESQIPW